MAGGQKQKPLASNFHQRFLGFPVAPPLALALTLFLCCLQPVADSSLEYFCLVSDRNARHSLPQRERERVRDRDNIVSMTTKSAQISGANAFSICSCPASAGSIVQVNESNHIHTLLPAPVPTLPSSLPTPPNRSKTTQQTVSPFRHMF